MTDSSNGINGELIETVLRHLIGRGFKPIDGSNLNGWLVDVHHVLTSSFDRFFGNSDHSISYEWSRMENKFLLSIRQGNGAFQLSEGQSIEYWMGIKESLPYQSFQLFSFYENLDEQRLECLTHNERGPYYLHFDVTLPLALIKRRTRKRRALPDSDNA